MEVARVRDRIYREVYVASTGEEDVEKSLEYAKDIYESAGWSNFEVLDSDGDGNEYWDLVKMEKTIEVIYKQPTELSKLKVINVTSEVIEFQDGYKLYSYHESDCCEHHQLTLDDLQLSDFDGLEFDLTNDSFFRRIPGFGIELIPIVGHPVRIPGHGWNNGYYSDYLHLIVEGPTGIKEYDITECQEVEG
jgi:hypothetical protein